MTQFSATAIEAFGDVGGYSPCGCCGGFHAVFETHELNPFGALNADERGGFGTNGKVSFSAGGAATQLTRQNLSWSATPGQGAVVTFAFRSTAPTTMPSETSAFSRFSETQIAATLLSLRQLVGCRQYRVQPRSRR